MLGSTLTKWGDLLVGSQGTLHSDCPWNTRSVVLPEAKFGEASLLKRRPGAQGVWLTAAAECRQDAREPGHSLFATSRLHS